MSEWLAAAEAEIVEIVTNLVGTPPNRSLSNSKETKWNNRGSISVNRRTGQFYSFEEGRGGGVIQAVQILEGMSYEDAITSVGERPQSGSETPARKKRHLRPGKPRASCLPLTQHLLIRCRTIGSYQPRKPRQRTGSERTKKTRSGLKLPIRARWWTWQCRVLVRSFCHALSVMMRPGWFGAARSSLLFHMNSGLSFMVRTVTSPQFAAPSISSHS